MDGNIANLEQLENCKEPAFYFIDAFPDLDGNDIGYLEDAYMKILQINSSISIEDFIKFIEKDFNS